MANLKTISWLNEKGNVSVKMRDLVRKATKAKALEVLGKGFDGVEENVNGGISIPVGLVSGTNEVIYAHFDMSVSTRTPDTKVEKKKSKKKAETVEVEEVDLFGAE